MKLTDPKAGMENFDSENYLKNLGHCDDKDIDLGLTSLALSHYLNPDIHLEKYIHHLKKLADELRADCPELQEGSEKIAALKAVLYDRHEYRGDIENYNNIQNADMVRVIERRQGMPIALCILYIHTGRQLGWGVDGINFPGHFLCSVQHRGRKIIFDPFQACKIMEAHDLRELIKRSLGHRAELSSQYYESSTNRETLIRLQNNIKLRQIEAEDYQGALKTIESMRFIDPDEYRLLLDAGVLYARVDQPMAAVRMLEMYIEKSPSSRDREEAAMLLKQVRESLH